MIDVDTVAVTMPELCVMTIEGDVIRDNLVSPAVRKTLYMALANLVLLIITDILHTNTNY